MVLGSALVCLLLILDEYAMDKLLHLLHLVHELDAVSLGHWRWVSWRFFRVEQSMISFIIAVV